MTTKRLPGLFITGTDTDVGKTYVASRIAAALHAAGRRVGVYKPIASGCTSVDGNLHSDDARALWEAAGRPGELARVCPQRFAAPLAPHLAARAEGRTVNAGLLRTGLDYWRTASDVLIVEGAGGLLSPVGDEVYVADLALEFGLPLVLVSDNSLGAINRTLSALVVAATYGQGMPVAGVLLNHCRGAGDDSTGTNATELAARAVPPVLGVIPWQGALPAGIDWLALAEG